MRHTWTIALLPLAALATLRCRPVEEPAAHQATGADGQDSAKDAAKDAAKGAAKDAGQEPDSPRVRLRISGDMRGSLEPCGCASGQLGGLARRMFKLSEDRDYDVLIEGGNMVRGGTPLDLKKSLTAMTVLDLGKPPYHAIGIGPLDLEQDPAEYSSNMAVTTVPLVASDLEAKQGFEWPVRPYAEHEVAAAGKGNKPQKLRIASFAGRVPAAGTGTKVTLLGHEAAWRRALQDAAPTTYRILLAHGDAPAIRKLSAMSPRPDLIVGLAEGDHDPASACEYESGVPIVWPGTRGRFLVDAWLTRTGGEPKITRYRVIGLEGSASSPGAMEDQATKGEILRHRHEVAKEDLLTAMAGQRPTANGAAFVGTETCGECHVPALLAWKKSKHAGAWQTLEDAASGKLKHKNSDKPRYGWPTTAYPDCVGCHVVGYGQVSGFVNPQKTPQLGNVGCESCHGPGSRHVDSKRGKLPPDQGIMGKCDVSLCLKCHDFEQSPGFDYPERWKKIEHGK